MSFARYQRKERLPYGAQKQIARQLEARHRDRWEGGWESVISRVMNDDLEGISEDRIRIVRVAIAKRLRMSVEAAFPAEQPATESR